MPALHTLWPISTPGFRVLMLSGRWQRSAPPAEAAGAAIDGPGSAWPASPSHVAAHAVTVAAPAAEVWAWLAQMLRGAGPYGWRELETPGCRSAEYLLDHLPPPAILDRAGDLFELARIVPGRELVWVAARGLEVLDVPFAALALHYELRELAARRTRFAVRLRASIEHVTASIAGHRFAMLDAILPMQQVVRIKALAEQPDRRLMPAAGRHQHAPFVAGRTPAHPPPAERIWPPQRRPPENPEAATAR